VTGGNLAEFLKDDGSAEFSTLYDRALHGPVRE